MRGSSNPFLRFQGVTIPFLFRQYLPVDFPVFNLHIPPNGNRFHRLKTTLRAG
jgi:hypothetical protein